ncbi:hypothetical protein HanHA300_Chr12g0449681 [Helianthus annuus]|nr:hypothetical protein HanHA300_Chr12g0449681 [Helianthus annuus]KAJ0863290.1 hypothetical protein HanPSC8_Chr12g0528261 [Helianthus annuus]
MSNKWPETSSEVPILKFENRGALVSSCFPHLWWINGCAPAGIRGAILVQADQRSFSVSPCWRLFQSFHCNRGAHLPNSRPVRAVTFAGKEILYLSSEEYVGSSNGEISSWSNIFVGVLRDLGIDPEEKKKKASKKKKKVITIDVEVTSKKGGSSRAAAGASDKGTLRFRQSNLEDYVVASDSLEGLSRIGEKTTNVAGSKSSGSAASRNPDAGATPSSIVLDEEEEEDNEEEPALMLVSRKRSREETVTGIKAAQKAEGVPVIGKQSKLCSLYKFSPG